MSGRPFSIEMRRSQSRLRSSKPILCPRLITHWKTSGECAWISIQNATALATESVCSICCSARTVTTGPASPRS